jgi:glucose/arabinose dehydrogenase
VFRTIAASMLCLGLCAACDKTDPAPTPSTGEPVTGAERFGWQQLAADAAELATIRHAVYVDGARRELTDVRCEQAATASGFACSAPLPALSTGAHLLELASFVSEGGTVLEGARSAGLRVVLGAAALSSSAALGSIDFTTGDGVALRLEPVVENLDDPIDLAFAPDGRIFVASATGDIQIVQPGARPDSSDGVRSVSIAGTAGDRLLAIALDPAFRDTHDLFALMTTAGADGRTFLLARFREQDGALVDRIVILDDVPAAATPSGSVRFGPDGKLYVALDDGGAAERANDLASRNGKLLRLNADGSTPADQASLTPVFAYGFRAPHAVTWQPSTGGAWLADDSSSREPLLYALERQASRQRSRVRAAFRLPAGTTPSSALFYQGAAIASFENNLFVASETGTQLLRFTFDDGDPLKIVSTERLLDARLGPIRLVAQAPDRRIYITTRSMLVRLIAGQP